MEGLQQTPSRPPAPWRQEQVEGIQMDGRMDYFLKVCSDPSWDLVISRKQEKCSVMFFEKKGTKQNKENTDCTKENLINKAKPSAEKTLLKKRKKKFFFGAETIEKRKSHKPRGDLWA